MEMTFDTDRILDFLNKILNQGNLWINVSIISAAFLGEILIVGWKRSSLNKTFSKDKSVRTDLVMTFFAVFNLTNLFSLILSLGLFQLLSKWIFDNTDFQLALKIENLYLQFFVLYLISDFKNYIAHWLMHNIKPFWKLHEFHHSATSFSVMTRYRLHFVEIAFGKLINAIPYAVFGAPLATFFIISWLEEFHQLLIHSKVKSDFGWFGRYILISPDAHKLHHSVSKNHYGKNYGTTLVIWDKLFGTYNSPKGVNIQLGIPENKYNKKGIVNDLVLGIKGFFRNLK